MQAGGYIIIVVIIVIIIIAWFTTVMVKTVIQAVTNSHTHTRALRGPPGATPPPGGDNLDLYAFYLADKNPFRQSLIREKGSWTSQWGRCGLTDHSAH